MSEDIGQQNCQQNYKDLAEATWPDSRSGHLFRRTWLTLRNYVWYGSILGPIHALPMTIKSTSLGRAIFKGKRMAHFSHPDATSVNRIPTAQPSPAQLNPPRLNSAMNLKPGEWVRVKSAKEILATLDADSKVQGLGIMPEMLAFCGRQFKVFKVVNKIVLESTGELRKMRAPTVLLEGTICDGSAHGGCDKSCFCFWREDWLERVPQDKPPQRSRGSF